MKYLFSAIVLFATFILLNAQEETEFCGTHHKIKEQWEDNPQIKKAYDIQHEAALNGYFNKNENVLVIPIVFHILHEYGNENISDEQVYDVVRIVNEDFRKLNPDISDVITNFEDIASDTKIEFRLASLDPFGNPTNGITRHYSHETSIGDDFSKLEQWPRGRYLNIWSVRSMKGGVAGYAYYPSGVEGSGRFRDGIILRHNFLGSIGTSTPYNARTLTHEIGHYLGLAHLWGSTNDPGLPVNCTDDDGIEDTPNTIGWTHCQNLYGATCDTVIDNIQNYMEYSYCGRMFTEGQADYMRNILSMGVSQRNNLWTEENIAVSAPEGIEFTPIADFYANRLVACVNGTVNFQNWTWRLSGNNNETYTWTFEDASVETSTDKNPSVSFTSPGWKTVSLTVEQDGESHTITKDNFIWISPSWPIDGGNVEYHFDDNPDYWIIHNSQNYPFQWSVRSDAGVNGSGAMFLNMSNPYDNPTLYTDEYFFNERRGGSKSSFISQPIDFTYLTDATISFDWACATDGSTLEEITEELRIYTSTDCGNTWIQRKRMSGTELINNGSGWDSFYPSNTTLWSTETVNLPNTLNGNILFKFEYTGSDQSNNIAIDNINIGGTVSTEEFSLADNLKVHPNPSNQELGWNINYDASIWGGADVQLTDVAGRVVTTIILPKNASQTNIKPVAGASNGIYFLRISNNNKVVQKKLILN